MPDNQGGGLTSTLASLSAPLTLASTALGVVKGVGDWFGANKEEKRANDELSRLKQPFYKIQDEYKTNQNIAGSLAGEGLTEDAKNYYTTEAQRGLGSSIGATQANGGVGGNDAGRLLDVYLNNVDKTAAQDAQAKIGNIQNFMNVSKELAGQKTMKWALDEYQPWQRKLKELTERVAAAKTNKSNAINTAIGSIGAGGTALSNSDQMGSLFRGNNGATSNNLLESVNPLQYSQPTNFVAQPNPVAFQAPQQGTWAAQTDINGNPINQTPPRPF